MRVGLFERLGEQRRSINMHQHLNTTMNQPTPDLA